MTKSEIVGNRFALCIVAGVALAIAGCASQPPAPTRPAGPSVEKPPAEKPPAEKPPVAKPAPAAKTGSRMSSQDAKAITDHHNKVRSQVGVGGLKWSPTLATFAQDWADRLAATSCSMKHRPDNNYGENLFQGTLGYYKALDASKAWESEKKDYKGGEITRANVKPVGHYTQMVWRDTTSMGCGEASCNKMLIIACNYDPPGNFLGRKPY